MDRTIPTARLILRPLRLADAAPSARLMTPAIARWTGSWRDQETAERVAERIERHHAMARQGLSFDRAITLEESGGLIGWIGVRRNGDDPARGSLGYWIGESWFGRGYTREAVRAILPHAFEALDLRVIEGVAQLANAASIAVLKGLGMRHIGQRDEFASARGVSDLCDCYEIKRPGP